MSATSRLQYLYLAYAAKPAAERSLYRRVRRQRATRLVELGISSLERTIKLLRVAQRFAAGEVSYTAIDLFEARNKDLARLSLREAHSALRNSGATIRLIPGHPAEVLSVAANTIRGTDLLTISHGVTLAEDADCWYFFPRMLHPGSAVLRETRRGDDAVLFDSIDLADIQAKAGRHSRRRAA